MAGEVYHEEEALGKAYDSRLMKRLLRYMRPYLWLAGLGVVLLIIVSVSRLATVKLTQIAIDDYLESVELVIEESAEEEVAKIVFTSESLEPREKANQYLEEIFSRHEGSMSCCASEGGD